MAIDRYEQQIYPLNRHGAFLGDDHRITFDDRYPLLQHPYLVRLRGWAPSATLDHTIYVDFTIEPLTSVPSVSIPQSIVLPEGVL